MAVQKAWRGKNCQSDKFNLRKLWTSRHSAWRARGKGEECKNSRPGKSAHNRCRNRPFVTRICSNNRFVQHTHYKRQLGPAHRDCAKKEGNCIFWPNFNGGDRAFWKREKNRSKNELPCVLQKKM